MKRFPYKFTILAKTLFTVGFILAGAVIAVNLLRFILTSDKTAYNYITLALTLTIAIFAIALEISVLAASYFSVDEKNLTLKWGFLKNTIPTSEITKLVRMEKSSKLIVYYGSEDNFYVVFIDGKYFDGFMQELIKANKTVTVEYTDG